jgi:hypothetical protein
MIEANPGNGFRILAREDFSDVTYSLVVHHLLTAKAAQSGWVLVADCALSLIRIKVTNESFG